MSASVAIKHIRNYASAGMLAAIASFVTFPLLTRALSVGEYGILGLVTASATLFIAVGKLGLQHGVIRYYAQVKNGNIDFSLKQMHSTVGALFILFATITALIWLAVGFFLMPQYSDYGNISWLFLVASGIVFFRLLGSCFLNFLRAQQRSAIVSVIQVMNKYLYLGIVVVVVLLGVVNVAYVLGAMFFAEVVAFFLAGKRYWPDFQFSFSSLKPGLGKSMLIYSMPLMMLESLGLIMRLSDRYIIQGILGENELGQYSASYNLTSHLDLIAIAALAQAIRPLYMQLWEGEGVETTRAFLSSGFRSYLILGIPLIAGFSLVAPHLLNFLASDKYSPGTIIIPFVAFSFLLEGCMHFLAAGLYIQKRTKVLLFWGFIATLINICFNVLLIPIHGILGAAVVTILSYSVFMIGVSYRSFEFLSFSIKTLEPLIVTMFSLLVYAMLFKLDFGGDFANILGKGFLGGALLGFIVLVCDAQIRNWVAERLHLQKVRVAK